MSDGVFSAIGLGRKPDASPSFDVIRDRMRAQRKRIIHAEGEEAKASNALDAAKEALEQEREALRAMEREFFSLAKDEGIKPEETCK